MDIRWRFQFYCSPRAIVQGVPRKRNGLNNRHDGTPQQSITFPDFRAIGQTGYLLQGSGFYGKSKTSVKHEAE